MKHDDKFLDADITVILGWLLPPAEPVKSSEEPDASFEARRAEHASSAAETRRLGDRLSLLFNDSGWTAAGSEAALKRLLGEWVLSPESSAELQRQVAASDEPGQGFREWLTGVVARWESGEGEALENPDFDETRPWTRYYKYDVTADAYFYARAEHADEWLTWDEWEPEPRPDSQSELEPDQEWRSDGELPAYDDAPPAELDDEPVVPGGQSASGDPGYPVYTHVATGLALPYHEESRTWLYQEKWLTDEQVTAAVNPVPGPTPRVMGDSDEPVEATVWGGWSVGEGDDLRYGLTEDGPWPYVSEESAQADLRIADETVARILEEYDVDPGAIYARVLKQVVTSAPGER